MARSILCVVLLLAILCVASGQSTIPEGSHCSCTFNAAVDDQLTKSLMISLQDQVNLLSSKLEEDVEKMRQKIATIEAGAAAVATVNVKQCSRSGLNVEKEYGVPLSCDFVKKLDDTVLRVVWNGNLRLMDTGPKTASCRRWFFTINGRECSDPSPIDAQLQIRDAGTNIHRPAYVEGYCRGVAAGEVHVDWNVGDCLNGAGWDQSNYNAGNSFTGWVSTVRIIVEEVDVENAEAVIV